MKEYNLVDYTIAIVLFLTIMAILTRVTIIKNILYYILWLAIIVELAMYGNEIAEYIKPLEKLK